MPLCSCCSTDPNQIGEWLVCGTVPSKHVYKVSVFVNILLVVDFVLAPFKHQQWSLQLQLQAQY